MRRKKSNPGAALAAADAPSSWLNWEAAYE